MSGSTGAQNGANTAAFNGTPQNRLVISVSSVGNGGNSQIDTVNMSYADVTLTGASGLAASTTFNLGASSTFRLATAAAAAGASVDFNAPDSHFVVQPGINVGLLRGIFGFQPGNTIDIGPVAARASYSDNAGAGTGGVLTLFDSSDKPVSTVAFGTGDYVVGNFQVRADGAGGTIVNYATAVTGVTANPPTADVGVGATIVLSVAVTDPLTVTGGTPTLSLNDGGTATYDAANSTPTVMAFTYKVGAGQNTADLAVTGLSLNGATLANAGGSPVDLSGVIVNPAGTLQVDTTAPILSGLVAAPGTADLGAGQVVQLSLNANEPITVSGGAPSLALSDGGIAIYSASLSSPTRLVFVHTVLPGQNTADLAVTSASLNGSLIADGAGNTTNLLNAIGNPAGTLQVDTVAPVITGVGVTPSDGTLTPGQTAVFTVGVNEPVSVRDGVPTLALNDGGTATYDPINSTPTKLVFTHQVQPGQNAADLAVTGVATNGATIADLAGNGVDLSGLVGNPPGILQVNGSTPTPATGTTPIIVSGGSAAGTATAAATATLGVYRFFDTNTGTHFFTADGNEKDGLKNSASRGYRPDLVQETNGFGAIDPNSTDTSKVQVYRFFDTAHGTHFFTASQTEADTLRNSNSVGYRPDLIFEASSSFYEHATQQSGDTAVYRFFDSKFGTHFYTGDQKEYTAITTPGAATFRADLVSEGVGFYAPTGTFT